MARRKEKVTAKVHLNIPPSILGRLDVISAESGKAMGSIGSEILCAALSDNFLFGTLESFLELRPSITDRVMHRLIDDEGDFQVKESKEESREVAILRQQLAVITEKVRRIDAARTPPTPDQPAL